MLGMHGVVRLRAKILEAHLERHRPRDRDRQDRGLLYRQETLLLFVDAYVAARRLAAAPDIARDVEPGPTVLGMASRASDLLLLVDGRRMVVRRLDVRVTYLATSCGNAREAGVARRALQ